MRVFWLAPGGLNNDSSFHWRRAVASAVRGVNRVAICAVEVDGATKISRKYGASAI